MKDFEKIIDNAWIKFESVCDGVHIKLADKIEFEFRVGYQPSDGAVIEYEQKVAPLKACTQIIAAKGQLSFDDFLKVCI